MKTKYHFRISLVLVFVLVLFFSATRLTGQKIEYIKVPELEKILINPDNKLFVVNFWATWCIPEQLIIIQMMLQKPIRNTLMTLLMLFLKVVKFH